MKMMFSWIHFLVWPYPLKIMIFKIFIPVNFTGWQVCCMYALFCICVGIGFVDWPEKRQENIIIIWEEFWNVHLLLTFWQTLIVLRWPFAVDRTLRSILLKCSCCCYSFPLLNFVLNLCWNTCFCVFSSQWEELVQETDHPDHKYQHPSDDIQWPRQPTANRPRARSDGGSCLQPRSSSNRLLPHYAEGFRQRCECLRVFTSNDISKSDMLIAANIL